MHGDRAAVLVSRELGLAGPRWYSFVPMFSLVFALRLMLIFLRRFSNAAPMLGVVLDDLFVFARFPFSFQWLDISCRQPFWGWGGCFRVREFCWRCFDDGRTGVGDSVHDDAHDPNCVVFVPLATVSIGDLLSFRWCDVLVVAFPHLRTPNPTRWVTRLFSDFRDSFLVSFAIP